MRDSGEEISDKEHRVMFTIEEWALWLAVKERNLH